MVGLVIIIAIKSPTQKKIMITALRRYKVAKKIEFEIGSNINNWTIIRKEPNTNDGKSRYLCKCICGNLSVVLSTYLYTGRSTKCKNCKQIKTSN